MSTYFAPGVYVEEVPSGPQPITPASTSVLAIIGSTKRGPVGVATRLSGWTDFQRIFAGNAGVGYTADAVYGFFENGGPAAFLVRADPSIAGTWKVKDGAAADSFGIAASSPGSWAADLVVAASPDRDSGSAQIFSATTLETKAFSGDTEIKVDSTAGISRGDPVRMLQPNDAATATDATVVAVTASTVTLHRTTGGAFSLPTGSVVTGVVPSAATQFTVTGTGIKTGDVVQAELGDRTRVTWRATDASPHGSGLTVTAASSGGAAVPGSQFTQRVERFRGSIAAASTTDVGLGAVTWLESAGLEPGETDLTTALHAWASDGSEGVWIAGTAKAFRFPQPPPAGPIEVEALLSVKTFVETRDWTDPTVDQLTAAYSFVPAGTKLRLVPTAGTGVVLTRAATGVTPGFTIDAPANAASLTASFASVQFVPDTADKGVLVRCARAPEKGDRVSFTAADLLVVTDVRAMGGDVYLLSFAETTSVAAAVGGKLGLRRFVATRFYPLRFALTISGPGVGEQFRGLALDPAHPQYYARDGVVNEVSSLITVAARAGGAGAPSPTTMPAFAVRDVVGSDQPPSPQDYIRAVSALDLEPEPAMIACPDLIGFGDELAQYAMVDALVRHCEKFRRFAVLDAPKGDDVKVLKWRNTAVASTYAAVFAPWVRILNLDAASTDRYRYVPPSGFVAGVMARTDRERGVHKAPGNERVSGIVGLEQQYTQSRQEALNPAGVNLIRSFPGRGSRVWGARNATDDVTWRYINVRRLFNFVEVSVDRGTQWVVFEPNTATTWLRVKASVEGLLDQLWRSGGLAGDTAAQAYRVRIGLGRTMTETDIENGLIITEVAIAPARPAEFVVFRFSHKRLSE